MSFCPLEDEYVWGKESFELADLGYRDSLIREGWLASNSISELMDTYMDRIRDMNHIHGDNLKEGQLLLIYYGKSMAEDTLEIAGR